VRKSNPNSKKAYEYLHLVDNVRTENGPRQRLILNLGTEMGEENRKKKDLKLRWGKKTDRRKQHVQTARIKTFL
jgi:hypothetical protein